MTGFSCCWVLKSLITNGSFNDDLRMTKQKIGVVDWRMTRKSVWYQISTERLDQFIRLSMLREYCTPNQKSACFVPYLKIIILKKIIYVSYSKSPKELKNGIEILVGQKTFFKLWIKTVKILFGPIIQEPLGLLKFQCYFWVPWTIYYKMHTLSLKKRCW